MPSRSSNQEVDEVGEGQLAVQLRPYAVNTHDNDYGLDFIVNLTEDPDEGDGPQDVLSDHFFVQLKSTTRFDPDTDSVHEDLEVRHLEQYVDQPIPVVLAIYDDNTEEIYWRVIQEYVWDHLGSENPNWRSQETVRIRIQRSQVITDYDRLEQAIDRTQNRITRRQNRGLNIGEGIAFTPDDFTELEEQAENDRLSYRGHTLLLTNQHLRQGNEEQARETVAEILAAEYDDEATVKALLVQIFMRNPAVVEEALEMAEIAEKAREIAADLGMENDRRLATILQHVASLFIFADKRHDMIATDRIQSLDEFEVPEFDYLRSEMSAELAEYELGAMGGISHELAALIEDGEYYVYAVSLPQIIDYLASRRQIQLLSVLGSETDENVAADEEIGPGDVHPLVDQAEQLADFVTEAETEANLRKSVGVYYYFDRDPDTATEYLTEARELAEECGDTALSGSIGDLLDRIDEVPNLYDTTRFSNNDEEERDRQEMAAEILEMQGIEVDLENPPDPTDDPMDVMAHHAVRDADPEPFYRHCEHLRIAYNPSTAGKMLGMASFGPKYLWCQHGRLVHGTSLSDMFDDYIIDQCEGCEHHCPRPDSWEVTEDIGQELVEDPDFQAAIDNFETALAGGPTGDPE